MKRETKPKARREVKRYAGPILTQWRGQPPIWDGVMRSVP